MEKAQEEGPLKSWKARFRDWETQALARAIVLESEGYGEDALSLIREELERRGVPRDRLRAVAGTGGSAGEPKYPLEGVNGWLGLFATWVLVGSIASLASALFAVAAVGAAQRWIVAPLQGGLGAFGLFAFWHLLRREPRAPGYAAIWVWANPAVTVVLALFSYLWAGSWDASALWGNLLCAGLGWAYLKRSKRVKATYSARQLTEEWLATFS